jgi:uncharacterized protein YjbJ (UPF0337 family)
LDDTHAQAALLEGDYLIADNTTGQHIRINKIVLRDAFDYRMESVAYGRRTVSAHSVAGSYYEFAGKIREWLGTVSGNEVEAILGKYDRLVGRVAREQDVSLPEAELIVEDSIQEQLLRQ